MKGLFKVASVVSTPGQEGFPLVNTYNLEGPDGKKVALLWSALSPLLQPPSTEHFQIATPNPRARKSRRSQNESTDAEMGDGTNEELSTRMQKYLAACSQAAGEDDDL